MHLNCTDTDKTPQRPDLANRLGQLSDSPVHHLGNESFQDFSDNQSVYALLVICLEQKSSTGFPPNENPGVFFLFSLCGFWLDLVETLPMSHYESNFLVSKTASCPIAQNRHTRAPQMTWHILTWLDQPLLFFLFYKVLLRKKKKVKVWSCRNSTCLQTRSPNPFAKTVDDEMMTNHETWSDVHQ